MRSLAIGDRADKGSPVCVSTRELVHSNEFTSSCSPSASKICAPLYDMSVEMPILAITLSMPSPTLLK
jgi:hypothetical protein